MTIGLLLKSPLCGRQSVYEKYGSPKYAELKRNSFYVENDICKNEQADTVGTFAAALNLLLPMLLEKFAQP